MRLYVFDASALLAFLQDKPGATKVSELLAEAVRGRAEIFMSAVNYGEVYGTVLRTHGRDRALATMSAVHPLPINLLDGSPQRALQAAEIKATYKLYYVDSFAAALTVEQKATLVTSDSDFRRLGHGFPLLWLKA
jgi:predicted nucleic acid-binding protein